MQCTSVLLLHVMHGISQAYWHCLLMPLSHTPVLCSSLCMPWRQVQHLRLIILFALVCCQHWLLIKLTPKGVVFLFFFSAVSNSMVATCGCSNMQPGCIEHALVNSASCGVSACAAHKGIYSLVALFLHLGVHLSLQFAYVLALQMLAWVDLRMLSNIGV